MATATDSGSQNMDAEQECRQRLAACYRMFAHFGWDEMLANHITLKVPGEDNAFLINPYGLHFSEVKASNLIKVDIDGNKLTDSPYAVNKAGFVQHSLFHRELPDVHAIIHTHTTATMAVASLEGGLRPTNFYSATLYPQISYHKFEGVTVREEEGPRFMESLNGRRILMLENHGPVVMAGTLEQAMATYWMLQRACEIQLAAHSAGNPIVIPDEVVAVHLRDFAQALIDPTKIGVPEFDAMIRIIDREDKSWRD